MLKVLMTSLNIIEDQKEFKFRLSGRLIKQFYIKIKVIIFFICFVFALILT